MKKYLFLTSALVVLSGTAEAACIQTPTCSSLGYTSSSSCDGGIKCPFGNAWNCTGPNNTTEINKIKNEITNIKNKITELENNSGSGSGSGPRCADCEVGDFVCGGQCLSETQATFTTTDYGEYIQRTLREIYTFCTDVVVEKTNGVCKKAPTKYSENQTKRLTYDEFMKGATITKDDNGEIICVSNEEAQIALSAGCFEYTELRIYTRAYYAFCKEESTGRTVALGMTVSTPSDYFIDSACTGDHQYIRGTSVLDAVKSYMPAEGIAIPNVTTFY